MAPFSSALSSRPFAARAALIFAGVVLVVLALKSFVYCPDDAFITYRYARNLLNGYGPVFNPGGTERVEGFSCPLFLIVSAILMKLPLGVEMIFRAKFFGILCGLGTLVVVQRLTEKLRLPLWAVCAAPIVTAAHASVSISCIDGMETIFGALLASSAALLTLKAFDPDPAAPSQTVSRAAVYAGLLFAGCALTRPEGLLMGVFALASLLASRKGRLSESGLRFALVFLVPVLAYFLWRKAYYGLWMPNTYYAKGAPLDEAFVKGAPYLLRTFFHSLNESPLLISAGAFWWVLVIGGSIGERCRKFPGVVLPLLVGAQMIFAVRSGGDWMGGWRYMAVAVPLGTVLAFVGLVEAGSLFSAKAGENSAFSRGIGLMGAALLFLCGLWGQTTFWNMKTDGYFSWAAKGWTLEPRRLFSGWLLERSLVMAEKLNAMVPPGKIVAYTEMGVTPYFAPQIQFLDCDGLTDAEIARLPGAKHTQIGVKDLYTTTAGIVGPHLKEVRKPDYLMLGTKTAHGTPLNDPGPALDGDYLVVYTGPVPSENPLDDNYLILWKRTRP